jgi:diguanylate cyclase (GGDEF)-like protein
VSPLIDKNRIIGFYGVDNPPAELLENISTLLKIMGYFIISLLRRRNLVRRLEHLSFYDQLTGCKNRHALDVYGAELCQESSIGVVYCDVIGLKVVNDTQGHHAGDELLIRASKCLNRVFGDYTVFRVGGDEFLILCDGITREELLEKEQKLKNDMKEHTAFMSIGCVWHPDSRDSNMDKLMAEADLLMYEDKRRYYDELCCRINPCKSE